MTDLLGKDELIKHMNEKVAFKGLKVAASKVEGKDDEFPVKVEVDAPAGFAYSLDGEIIYESHFTVEIVPAALQLAVPQ